jgi:hypothetical protein
MDIDIADSRSEGSGAAFIEGPNLMYCVELGVAASEQLTPVLMPSCAGR